MTIHVEICKLMPVKSIGGRSYSLTMNMARFQFSCVQILMRGDEAAEYIIEVIAWVERNAKETIKRVRADKA